jgi:hypothetical protein
MVSAWKAKHCCPCGEEPREHRLVAAEQGGQVPGQGRLLAQHERQVRHGADGLDVDVPSSTSYSCEQYGA